MRKDIAVIGLGTFGYELAVQLSKDGHNVMAIDIDEKKINDIKDKVTVAIEADVTDKDVLKRIEIDKFDEIIFGMSSALESIILSITLMKKMNVKHIIGKANTRIQKEILLKIGADDVILPEISTAIRLAEKLTNPGILEKFKVDKVNTLMEVQVPASFHHKSLRELDLRRKHGLNVVMRKQSDRMEVISDPDLKFNENDIVFVIGNEAKIKKTFLI